MPVIMTRKNVSDFAKAVGQKLDREIKHTDIIELIAESLGERPDAMMHRLKSEDRGDLRKIPEFDIWSLVRGTKMDVRNAEVLFFSLGRKYRTDFSLSLVSQFGFDLVSTDYGLEYYEKILASGESGDRAGAFSVTLYHDTSLGGDLSGRRTGWEACLNFRDSEKSSTGCTILFDDPGGQSILSLATALRHIESTWVKHSKDAWALFLETGKPDFVMDRLGPIGEDGEHLVVGE